MTYPPPPPKHGLATPGVNDYVRNTLLKKYSGSISDFYLHLYYSSGTSYEKGNHGEVPISLKYRRKHFRTSVDKKETFLLSNADLLKITGYDKGKHKSRKYSIPSKELFDLTKLHFEDVKKEPKGKTKSRLSAKATKKSKKDSMLKNKTSPLQKQAINSIKGGIMNHAEALRNIGDQLEMIDTMSNQTKFICKCIHDIHNLAKASENGIIVDGILRYQQDYSPKSTGRIFESYGFQSLSKGAKRAAMIDIGDVYNYDIRSSQIAALCQEAEKVGINTSVLRDYMEDPNAKIRYAEKCGFTAPDGKVHSTVWKKCLMSLVFGSSMAKYYGTPYEIIREFDAMNVLNLFKQFEEVAAPFQRLIKSWNRKLDKYVSTRAKNHKHGRFFTNSAGMKINLDKDEIASSKKKLSAFILQGLESGFIHHLTTMADQYGYRVLSNEHDGLVTIGEIPEKAIQIAKDLSGFELASLEIKKF
jgi:hypothetical protein